MKTIFKKAIASILVMLTMISTASAITVTQSGSTVGVSMTTGPKGDQGPNGADNQTISPADIIASGPWEDIRAAVGATPGAIGDGNSANATRNLTAINAHIDAVSARGGGEVLVPLGWFKTNGTVKVKSNVRLVGLGYGSHIDNIATSGFSKCTVVTGNIGDVPGATGMYAETRYSLTAISAGSNTVTFASSGDAATFTVGDTVAIMSWQVQPSDTRYPVQNDLNVVTAKSGATLTLRYAVADTYDASSGNPTIARVSGSINGYDGTPLWVAQNATVANLRLTNATGLSSGWYALFAAGIGNTYENLWADNASGVIGSNSLGHSIIRNVRGAFDLRGMDMGDLQVSNILEDIKLTRFGLNTTIGAGSALGVGCYSGTDVTINRLEADLGGYGQVSMLYVNRGKYTNSKVTHAGYGTNVGILSGYGGDMEVSGCTVNGSDRHGIYVVGERAKIRGNTISNPGITGTFYAISIKSTVSEYMATGNVCGVSGTRTTNDRIVQDIATSTLAIIRDNISYDSAGGTPAALVDSTYVDTGYSAGPVTLKSYSITGGSTRPAMGYRIIANGFRNGSAGTKQVQLMLGSTPIAVVNYGASDATEWSIDAYVSNSTNSTRARTMGRGYLGAALQYSTRQDLTGALDSDTTINLQASVANAADLMAVYQFIVQPIY